MSNAIGYSASEAVSRLVSSVGKVQKTTMALIVMAKMKGRTNKAIRLAFGDKCPSWISGAFTYSDKFMAAVLGNTTQAEISALTIASAETELVRRIDAHMTALGVTSFEKYKSVCHFSAKCEASENVLNPPADEAAPNATTEAEAEAVVLPPEVQPERDLLAEFAAILSVMTTDERIKAAVMLQESIMADAETTKLAEGPMPAPRKSRTVRTLADLAVAA